MSNRRKSLRSSSSTDHQLVVTDRPALTRSKTPKPSRSKLSVDKITEQLEDYDSGDEFVKPAVVNKQNGKIDSRKYACYVPISMSGLVMKLSRQKTDIDNTDTIKKNEKSTPKKITKDETPRRLRGKPISTPSQSVSNESTASSRGRRSAAPYNKDLSEDAQWNNVDPRSYSAEVDSSKKAKKRPKSVAKKTNENNLQNVEDGGDESEADENDMSNANRASPKKRQKPNIDFLETPTKATPSKNLPTRTPRTANKKGSETPSTQMSQLSLDTPSTPVGCQPKVVLPRSSARKALNYENESNPPSNSITPKKRKSRITKYNDFGDSIKDERWMEESESGDDGDRDFEPGKEDELSDSSEEESEYEDESDTDYEMYCPSYEKAKKHRPKTPRTPKTPRVAKTPKSRPVTPSALKVSMETPTKQLSRLNINALTPVAHKRISSIAKPSTPLQASRQKLHVSYVPKSLPCREEEFNNIYTFLKSKLSDGTGGCIYISGVPGTGKTATVNEVIRELKKSMDAGDLPKFEFVEINGMKMSEPRQAYVQIWKKLKNESRTSEDAQRMLQDRFSNSNSKRGMTLLLVDELDLLCTKRQDVIYNLLDWPSKKNAKLVVVTIANTMDLPERILMGKVTSRLGLTRLTFQPYSFKQLEEIVVSRLKNQNAFDNDTIQLAARKVAAVSGDARRALDICRRATEVAEANGKEMVTMIDIKQALDEMIASPKIQTIKHCSVMEKYFLQAVCAEVERTGQDEVVFKNIYSHMKSLMMAMEGQMAPNVTQTLFICARLGSYRLLLTEHSRQDIYQRVILNVSKDDVYFATKEIQI